MVDYTQSMRVVNLTIKEQISYNNYFLFVLIGFFLLCLFGEAYIFHHLWPHGPLEDAYLFIMLGLTSAPGFYLNMGQGLKVNLLSAESVDSFLENFYQFCMRRGFELLPDGMYYQKRRLSKFTSVKINLSFEGERSVVILSSRRLISNARAYFINIEGL